jgi:hypothetical protein
MVALDDVRRLAAELDRFLDRVLDQIDPDQLSSAKPDGPCLRHAQFTRREQLERYVGTMSTAQRLRVAGALHLLSGRLDTDLADPDQRASHAGGLTPADDARPRLGVPAPRASPAATERPHRNKARGAA